MLHAWRIDEREYARHEARRGRRHAYETIDPGHSALVVIDMVPFFVEQNPYAEGIVSNVMALAAALRSAGGTVAWVVPGPSPLEDSRREFLGDSIFERYQRSGGTGPPAARVWPGLAPASDDIAIDKTAASAFFPGRCDLAAQLQSREVDTVIVAGTVANVCCESTVRDASTLGFRTIMAADANAAVCDADLNATLHTVYRTFGDVRSTDDLLDLIGER